MTSLAHHGRPEGRSGRGPAWRRSRRNWRQGSKAPARIQQLGAAQPEDPRGRFESVRLRRAQIDRSRTSKIADLERPLETPVSVQGLYSTSASAKMRSRSATNAFIGRCGSILASSSNRRVRVAISSSRRSRSCSSMALAARGRTLVSTRWEIENRWDITSEADKRNLAQQCVFG